MKKWILGAALSGALFTGASAETTNTNTIAEAERIIVTATRSASDVRNVPGNPSVVTAQDISAGHYTSVPEALEKKAGIFFRNYADNPSQASVDIRGFGGDNPHGKVLVLVNGRKLNRPDMAVINWAQIPMQAVERIEVVRGPNSVLYGDHAVGGVINIITRDGAEIPETSLQASAGSYAAYDQNVVTSGKLNGLGYVATAGHQSGDGYRDRSAYDTSSGSLRLSGAINERVSAYAEGSVVKEKHELPGALTNLVTQNRRQSTKPADEADETYYAFNTGIKVVPTDELVFDLDGGISSKDLKADMASYWIPSYYNYKINSFTLSPKVTLLTPVANMDNEFILGSDLARETLATKKFNDQSRTLLATDTKVTKDLIGGYVADTLSLTDKLLLSGGVRLEQNKVNAHHENGAGVMQYDDSQARTEKAWQTALNWMPSDTVKLFTSVKSTYRYPFIDEQAIYSGGYWPDVFNKDLKPETGINYETGVEITPTTNLVLQATAFHTDMKNEIAAGAGKNENLDETTHRGIELHAGYKNEAFAIDGYYTWLQSEFTAGVNNGNEIPWVPQNKLDVNLALFLTDALTFSTHMSYVGSMYQSGDNANTGSDKQSDYTIVDLLLEYRLPIKKFETKVFAGIDNVFATEYNYLVYWSGYYPAPERTYKAGLGVKF